MLGRSIRASFAAGASLLALGCPGDEEIIDNDGQTSSSSESTSTGSDPDSSTSEDPSTSTTMMPTTVDPDSSSSTGTSTSESSTTETLGCGDGMVDLGGGEECDGSNLDGRDCMSEGFADGVLACSGDCTLDYSGCNAICGDGRIAADEQCEGADLGGATCMSEGFDGGDLSCGDDCLLDVSACEDYFCGDNITAGPEGCDGTDLLGNTCESLGFDSGTLQCAADCSGFDTSACFVCGDGAINGDEQCDGNALNGQTCISQGLDGGVLGCNDECTFDLAECTGCGNGDQDPGEDCDTNDFSGVGCDDLGFVGGTPTCTAACEIESTSCFGVHTFCVQPNASLLGQPTTSEIDVAGLAGVLVDVDVVVDATHTSVGQLTMGVQHFDSGLGVTLVDQQCGIDNDIDATFDQDALTGPACGGPPAISGSVLPEGDLDVFVDGPTAAGNGTWELAIANASMIDGNLAQWCVNLTTGADGESFAYVVNDTGPNSVTGYSIAADGSLTALAASPFDTGGTSSFNHHPDALVNCGPYLYASNQSSNSIAGFTVEADGALTPLPGSPFAGTQPVSLACNDTHLFATNFGNSIRQYSIAADGALTDIGSVDDAAFSTLGITMHRESNRLVVAGWSSQVSVYDVADDGGLSHVPGSPYFTGGSNHSASISPNGAHVANEGQQGGVVLWNVADDGSLSFAAGSPFVDPTPCEVVGLAWSPDSTRLFVGHRGCFPGQVMVYDVADDGVLTAVPGAPFLTGGDQAVGLAVGAGGTRLYVSHIGSPLTSVFDVAVDGVLTPVPGSPFANPVDGNHNTIVVR